MCFLSVALWLISEVCPVPCSTHSVCVAGRCQCEEGWEGTTCDKQACHPTCEEHGECRDGQCVCQPGWEGEHCTIGMSKRVFVLYYITLLDNTVQKFGISKILLICFFVCFIRNGYLYTARMHILHYIILYNLLHLLWNVS